MSGDHPPIGKGLPNGWSHWKHDRPQTTMRASSPIYSECECVILPSPHGRQHVNMLPGTLQNVYSK
eukprot:891496-Amphidinium_carterae.1